MPDMEQRMGQAEGDIRSLREWRKETADPWIREDKDQHGEITEFMTTLKAVESERTKTQDERHKSNNTKLNLLVTIGAIWTVIEGIYLMIHGK